MMIKMNEQVQTSKNNIDKAIAHYFSKLTLMLN